MSNLQVLVGGIPATVTYKGRSGCCAGVDQIVIEIPRGVEGCYVPVVVRIGDVVSNFASLSIASTGDVCTDLNGLSGTDLEKLQTGGTISTGHGVARRVRRIVATTTTTYCVTAQPTLIASAAARYFSRAGLPAVSGQTRPGLPSIGSCSVVPPLRHLPGPFTPARGLGCRAGVERRRAKGKPADCPRYPRAITRRNSRQARQKSKFLEPGDYVIDNGAGGADIGPFRAALSVSKAFTPTVQRSASGVKIAWTGGSPTGVVIIEGIGAPSLTGASARFICTERVSAGQFTIPAEVFLSLPPDGVDHAGLTVSASSSAAVTFRARGLDYGQFSFVSVAQ